MTIMIGTEYRKTNNNRETQIIKEENPEEGNKHKIVQNALEFADDTQLLIEHDTEEQMNERVGNYDIVTETRRLQLHRGKVVLLRKGTNRQKEDMPPPFNEVKRESIGAILGEEINMNGSLNQTVMRRMGKAQHTWKHVNYKLLRNKAIAPRIKLILRNSQIRSTMIY